MLRAHGRCPRAGKACPNSVYESKIGTVTGTPPPHPAAPPHTMSHHNKSRAEADRAPCLSGKKGDFPYAACSAFCKAQLSHCGFCKCRACPFCSADGKLANTAAVPKTGTTGPSTKVTSAGSSSSSGSRKRGGISTAKAPGDVTSLQAALHAAEGRARQAEARLSAMEKQLGLCRHSASSLRASLGRAPPPAPRRRHGANETAATLAAAVGTRCSESIEWAMRVGIATAPASYPGLTRNSSAHAFQLHLFLNDPATRCMDPRDADALAEEAAAEAADARADSIASALLMLGLVACALCNAYSLGYLSCTNRYVRAVLRTVGCAPELVR